MQRCTPSMLAFLWGTLAATPAAAGTFSLLYTFQGGADGTEPNCLIGVGATLYGTTLNGGSGGYGTLFSFDPATKSKAVLHAFPAVQGDGAVPVTDGLLNLGGTLFGTTSYGGDHKHGGGVVFSFDTANDTETIVHALRKKQGLPSSALTQHGGRLYGTTATGGENGKGSIYRLGTSMGHLIVVHAFNGKDGIEPTNTLLSVHNTLYGTTLEGGTKKNGVVFSLQPNSETYTVMYAFSGGSDGGYPDGTLTLVKGILYGVTIFGGSSSCGGPQGCGTVFKIDPSSGAETALHAFQGGTDGAYPQGGLVTIGTKLYGVTSQGGTGCGGTGCGTVFSVDTRTGATTIEHALDGTTEGESPEAMLVNGSGTLYGTAITGGSTGNGTLFSYAP